MVLDPGSVMRRLRTSWVRQVLLLALDAAIAAVALWLAMLLRFEGRIDPDYAGWLPVYLAVLVPARALANVLLKLHSWSFRFSGLADGSRIGVAGLLGTGIFMVVVFMLQHHMPPRSVVVLELLMSTAAMTVLRF